jgi:hypothetical protein
LLLTPPHSSSFLLTPPHSSSLLLIPPHSSSFLLTPPHSSSLLLTPLQKSGPNGTYITTETSSNDLGKYIRVFQTLEIYKINEHILENLKYRKLLTFDKNIHVY